MIEALNRIAEFLSLRHVPELTVTHLGEPVDVIVLVGSSLLDTVHAAARALQQGCGGSILITGGVGHSTQDLRDQVARHSDFGNIRVDGRPEAQILGDILEQSFVIDPALVVREDGSTSCGANAAESKVVLDALGGVSSMLVIQDPTMQRRTQATFERAFGPFVRIVSFAPFVPVVENVAGRWAVSGGVEPIWDFERFVSLLMGEIDRLRDEEQGYGPKGRNYFDHVEVPYDVIEAYKEVKRELPSGAREVV